MARFSCVFGIVLGICSAGPLLASEPSEQFNGAMIQSMKPIDQFCEYMIDLKNSVEYQLKQIDEQITTYGERFPSVIKKGSDIKNKLDKKLHEVSLVLSIVQAWKADIEEEIAVVTRLNDKRPEFQNLVERLEGLMTTEAAERDKTQVDVLMSQLSSIVQFALNSENS